MLAGIFEALFGLVIEVVFEVVGEVLTEVGFSFLERQGQTTAGKARLMGFVYVVVGALLGVLTFYFFPHYLIGNEALRIVSRLASPLLMGFILCLVSWIVTRRDRGEGLFRLDKFVHGVLFGSAYSLTRYALT